MRQASPRRLRIDNLHPMVATSKYSAEVAKPSHSQSTKGAIPTAKLNVKSETTITRRSITISVRTTITNHSIMSSVRTSNCAWSMGSMTTISKQNITSSEMTSDSHLPNTNADVAKPS